MRDPLRHPMRSCGLLLLASVACGRGGMVVPVTDDGTDTDASSSGTATTAGTTEGPLDTTTVGPWTTTGFDTDTDATSVTATSFDTTDSTTTDSTTDSTTTGFDTDTDTSSGSETTEGPPPECGNGIVEEGEQCDPGEPLIGPDQACVPGCEWNVCGDGMQGPTEQCDDGNLDDDDLCHVTCTIPFVVSIAAGGNHTCARVDNGSLRCWGNGNNGRLGYGNEDTIGDDELVAAAGVVSMGLPAAQVVTGIGHTCVRHGDGTVRCWGRAAEGQLGQGNLDDLGDDELPSATPVVPVGGVVDLLATGSGSFHECALLSGGAVRCWGAAGNGRLGVPGLAMNVGDDEPSAAAPLIDLGGIVTAVTTGAEHGCARLADASIRCWGGNASGQLGLGQAGDVGDDETPASVGPIAVGGSVAQVVAGWFHTCALLDTGAVRCWGRGNNGRLGYGNTTWIGLSSTPADHGPVDVGGVVVELAAGNAHTCARLDTGAVRCWGWGAQGQLGYGNTQDVGDNELPSSAGDVSIGGTAVQVVAGSNHTCVLLDSGSVRCWGNGGDGRLGYGTLASVGDDESPASVGDVPVFQ